MNFDNFKFDINLNLNLSTIQINVLLGIIQTVAIGIPIVWGILYLVKFLSTKFNIKYYEEHPQFEETEERLKHEKEELNILKYRLRRFIIITIICICVFIFLEITKRLHLIH